MRREKGVKEGLLERRTMRNKWNEGGSTERETRERKGVIE